MSTFELPAGEYIICDLCYVISNDDWPRFCDNLRKEGLYTLCDGKEPDAVTFDWKGHMTVYGDTAYGDGEYYDYENYKYFVDSGGLGIIHVDCVEKGNIEDITAYSRIVKHDYPFTVVVKHGIFQFGTVRINTR